MKRLATLFLTLALLGGVPGAWAQVPPTPAPTPPAPTPTPTPVPPAPVPWIIDGPTTVKEFELGVFTLSGGSAKCVWLVMPAVGVSKFTAGQTLVAVAKPGIYDLVAIAVAGGDPVIVQMQVEFQGTPTPPPPVPPTPGPTPNPTPVPTGDVWALAIYDTSQQILLPSGQLAIYGSPTIQAGVKTAGAYWKRYDVADSIPTKDKQGNITQQPLTSTRWGGAATKAGLPALVVIDSTGAILSATPLPATEADVIAAVKAAVGK